MSKRNPLVDARKMSLMTQEDLGKRLGCSAMTVSNTERRFPNITVQALMSWYANMSDAGKQVIREYIEAFFSA